MKSRILLVPTAILVVCGRVEWGSLILFLLAFALGDAIITQKVFEMDVLYYPADALILFVIAMAIGGIVSAIGWACIKKDASSHAGEAWKGKYIASMMMTMIVSPLLSAVLLGWACQEWFMDIDSTIYCILLILVTFALSKYVLEFFNEGLKSTLAMLKGDIKDAKDGAAAIQDVVDNKPKM
jgi:uncharacterized membrane protein YbjE (DUF340 family)